MTSACVKYATLIGAREGELSPDERGALADHLAGCERCQARLADAEALAALLPEALLAEANGRDFSTFSDGVLARIPQYRDTVRGAPARGRLVDWVRHHRLAAALGTLAPALAALAIVVYVGRAQSGDDATVQVSAESGTTMVLDTHEGPVVLFADADDDQGS